MKAKWYALPVLLITMLLFVSLAGAQETVQTLRVAVGANDPRSIDPQQAIDTKDWTLLSHLFPGLTVLDEETKEIEPGLAQSWEVSGDGLTYTFHLLEGVPWVRYNAATDAVEQVLDDAGNPRVVTAEDVAFGWTRALDPATGSPAAYILAPYVEGGEAFNAGEAGADAVAIEAVDDYTFRVTAPESVGFALGIYSIINARPTPEWAITAAGDAWTEPENINTYGPYTLKEWQHEGSLTFVKNPFWPGSAGVPEARIDEVELLLIDEVAGLRAYEAGTIDAATVPGDQLARIQASAELGNQVEIVPDTCSQAWGFNTEKAPFDNVHIRRAFNYAVDRQALIESVLGGGEIPAFFFTPPSISLAPSSTASSELGIHFDPALAKEELQLGLNDLGLSSADQLPPINVQFGTSPVLSAVAQALQIMWLQTLGIQVELSQLDNSVYWATQAEDAGQIHRAGWCPDYNDANNYLRDVMRSDSIYNYGNWANADFDRVVDEARVLTDPEARRALYSEAEQIMVVDDAAIMPLYWPVRISLTNPRIERTYATTGVEAFNKWAVRGE